MFCSSEKKGCDVILWEVVWSECLLSLNVPTTCNSFSMHCIAFTINQTYCGKCMKKKPNNCTGGGGSRIWVGGSCPAGTACSTSPRDLHVEHRRWVGSCGLLSHFLVLLRPRPVGLIIYHCCRRDNPVVCVQAESSTEHVS